MCNSEGVAKLTINRESRLNALSHTLIQEMRQVVRIFSQSDDMKVLIITGTGKRGFCSGADVRNMDMNARRELDDNLRTIFNPFILELAAVDKLTIAQVNGIAAGAGFALAMACDFRISGESGLFLSAFVRIALVPDCGLSYFLPRAVGSARALEIMALGETIPAKRAQEWGMVNRVVADSELEDTVHQFAHKLAQGPTAVHGWTKRLTQSSFETSLATILEREAVYQQKAGKTTEFAEAVTRFQQSNKKTVPLKSKL